MGSKSSSTSPPNPDLEILKTIPSPLSPPFGKAHSSYFPSLQSPLSLPLFGKEGLVEILEFRAAKQFFPCDRW